MIPASSDIQKRIRNIARHYYPKQGSHGWDDHIQDVYRVALALKGKPLDDVQYASVLMHDIARRNIDKDHNILGAQKAYKTLSDKNILTQKQRQAVKQAILQHSSSYRKRNNIKGFSSDAAKLLALADKGTVYSDLQHLVDRPMRFIFQGSDINRFKKLNKEVPYNINSDDDIADRVHFQLNHWFGTPYIGPQTAWSKHFQKQLKDRYETVSKTTPEDIKPLIHKYRELYNKLVEEGADTSPSQNPTYMAVK